MKKSVIILAIGILVLSWGCEKNNSTLDDGLYGLTNFEAFFDFSDPGQLLDLPTHGIDCSYISNEKLHCPIAQNAHKGLGRKFHFSKNGGEPNEAEIEFDIWLDSDFQKYGVNDECGKFPGFEGIYDLSAGWGLRRVTDQPSWSIRIGHGGENDEGKIPLALYVYHPQMPNTYGTTVDLHYSISKEQTHTFKLYVKLNDVNQENGVMKFSDISENGIMKFYVDDVEIYNSTTWLFRTDPDVHIKSVWLDAYIGGGTPSRFDTYILLDNLRIKW